MVTFRALCDNVKRVFDSRSSDLDDITDALISNGLTFASRIWTPDFAIDYMVDVEFKRKSRIFTFKCGKKIVGAIVTREPEEEKPLPLSQEVMELVKNARKRLASSYPTEDMYGSRCSLFGMGLHDGAITQDVYNHARQYYGRLWDYVGD